MSVEMKVPGVGESITEVVIASWHKADGEHVEADEIVAELESDKATFELPAEASGTLHHKAKEGETLEIGALICTIEEGSGNGSQGGDEKSSAQEAPAEPKSAQTDSPEEKAAPGGGQVVEMVVPAVGESIAEVTIGTWNFKDGDQVEKEAILCEIESDKATFDLPAEASGTLRIVADEGETLEIGALICTITEGASAPAEQPTEQGSNGSAAPAQSSGGSSSETYASGHPSPAAAKILAEKGIEAKDVKGTGVDGRITKEDAVGARKGEAKAETKPEAPKAAPAQQAPAAKPTATPAASTDARGDHRQRMTQLRKTIARRLVAAKNETAMLTTFNELNMQPIMDVRRKYKDVFKEKFEVGLGFMSFFTKACCVALQEFPAVNAQIDGDDMITHDYVDISIAVSAPRGLVVPVVRDAHTLSFDAIEKEIIRLATRARDNKLTIEEMTGGTFTITNGGIFGSMMSTPIINAPQSAILGMHNIVERAVVENGQVVVRPMMYLALSYDHRVIDGRESVSFLVRVKQLLEDPTRLLLGV